MDAPLFRPPIDAAPAPCQNCRYERERAETYRARMKAADKQNARLLGELARLKDDLDYYKAQVRD